jgi:hypothetical protein
MSENLMLRKMLGGETGSIGRLRRLHNAELHDMNCSPNIYSCDQIKEVVMGRESSTRG